MNALPSPPAPGSHVYVPTRVRRSMQPTRATVKGIAPHSLLVAINGRFKYVDPADARKD